jgi:hypothetical protein
MAVRTETVQFHSCDLCGEDRDEADLIRLYGPPQAGQRVQIDICQLCQQRPIAEIVEWMRRKREVSEPRQLQRVRGGRR